MQRAGFEYDFPRDDSLHVVRQFADFVTWEMTFESRPLHDNSFILRNRHSPILRPPC